MPKRWTQKDVKKFALGLPGVELSSHMGRPDLRVGGKIFATLPEDGLSVNIKLGKDQIEMLSAADPERFESIWGGNILGVTLARAPITLLKGLLSDGHGWRVAKSRARK